MANIGGGAPITIRKGNLMEYTRTIQPINMMNSTKKNTGRENPTKRSGTSIQGTVKTQMEVLEEENISLYPHIRSLHYALNVELTSRKKK